MSTPHHAYEDMTGLLEMAADAAEHENGCGSTIYQLGKLAELRELIDYQTTELVAEARSQELSWEVIGRELGVTKQAAQQKYGAKRAPHTRGQQPLPL